MINIIFYWQALFLRLKTTIGIQQIASLVLNITAIKPETVPLFMVFVAFRRR